MKKYTFYLMLLLTCFSACKKHEEIEPEIINEQNDSVVVNVLVTGENTPTLKDIYVLNEGTWHQNNASITWFNVSSSSLHKSYFEDISNRGLGDVANDMILDYPHLFVVVNGSNTIEKINLATNTSTQLSILNFQTNEGRSPRRLFLNNNGDLYVSNFDRTVNVIDTATFSVVKTIRSGNNSEGLVVANDKLFVCNSGGLDFPNYDSTVSVISLNPITALESIIVGVNPSNIFLNSEGDLFVQSNGNYDDIEPKLYVINSETHIVEAIQSISLTTPYQIGDSLFFYDSNLQTVSLYDLKTKSVIDNNILDVSFIEKLTALAVDPLTQTIFVGEGYNYVSRGKLYGYSYKGVQMISFDTGVIPSKIKFTINK